MNKVGISHAPEGGLPFTYYLTTPTGFDPAKESLPMIVFLHGAGERGEDIQKVLRHGIPKYFSADNDYRGLRVLTLSPQCPTDMVWSSMVRDVKRVIDEVAAENNVDLSRISITGLSMGGFGSCLPDRLSVYEDLNSLYSVQNNAHTLTMCKKR